MIVGVISDTHDNLGGLKKAIQILKENRVEMVVHCGDWVSPYTLEFFDEEVQPLKVPIKSVLGNNPGDIKRIIRDNSLKKNPVEWAKTVTLKLDLGDKKAIVYHGDDYEILGALIDCQKYDVVFTGHTHTPRNEMVGKTLVLNPGATCYACEGKIIEKASVAIYDSTTNQAKIIFF
jgi:putative phosphoesterase